MKLPPKQAFPHVIQYKEYLGEDDWQKPVYSEPTTLNAVRFDEGYDFKRNGVNTTDDAPNSLVVLFKKYNANMPSFKNRGVVTFNKGIYTIIKVVPLYFMNDEVIGYELEVK